MPTFKYKAIDASGAWIKGVVESPSSTIAIASLTRQGLHPSEIEELADSSANSSSSGSLLGRVSAVEMALFLRQLATLINSDVPLVQSLTILERQMKNARLKGIIATVREDVQGGTEFSRALQKHPQAFSPLAVSMTRVGETGGVLGKILDEVATITERDETIRSEVRAAMIYPSVVVCVGILVVTFLMVFVVPKLTGVLSDIGTNMPLPTQMLLVISAIAKKSWWAIALVIAGLFIALRAWRATDAGRLQFDRFVLHMPVLGGLALKSSISRFSRALGVLLGGGVPLLEALRVVKGVLNNAALGAAIDRASSGLREGGSLADQLDKQNLFPPLVTHMVAVGENSGKLDQMLAKIADTYDWQTQQSIKIMLSLLAPMMILVLAVVVGFIALALVLPLLSIQDSIR